MRLIDGQTGAILEEGSNLGAADQVAPTAPAVAAVLGVPVGWVIVAGIVLWVCGALRKRGR